MRGGWSVEVTPPLRVPRRTHISYVDLEETVVCPPICASRLLQDVGGIQAPSSARSLRRAFVHACRAQEAHVHVRHCLCREDVLSPGAESRRGAGVGQGHPGRTGCTHAELDDVTRRCADSHTPRTDVVRSPGHADTVPPACDACLQCHVV